MKEDLLIKELTNGPKRRIKLMVNSSVEFNIEDLIEEATKEALRYTITIPEEGYFGQIGVMKEAPIRNSDLPEIKIKIRKVLNEALLKAQSDKVVKTIGKTAAISLIKGAFEAEEETFIWSYHEFGGKITIRVELDKTHYLTMSVHFSSNMLSDIDKIIPAAKKARQMIEDYGADLTIERTY